MVDFHLPSHILINQPLNLFSRIELAASCNLNLNQFNYWMVVCTLPLAVVYAVGP